MHVSTSVGFSRKFSGSFDHFDVVVSTAFLDSVLMVGHDVVEFLRNPHMMKGIYEMWVRVMAVITPRCCVMVESYQLVMSDGSCFSRC